MRVRAALLPVVRSFSGVHVAVRSSGVPPESVRNFSFAPPGLVHFPLLHPGLRRGLHSFAASRLAPRSATLLEALVHVGRPWGESPCDFFHSLVRNQVLMQNLACRLPQSTAFCGGNCPVSENTCANFCPFVFDFSRNLDCLSKGAADTMRVLDCGLLFNISPRITVQGNHAYGTQI